MVSLNDDDNNKPQLGNRHIEEGQREREVQVSHIHMLMLMLISKLILDTASVLPNISPLFSIPPSSVIRQLSC